MPIAEALRAHCRAVVDAFSGETLFVLPDGHPLSLADGYIPLLVNFTHEDKAAKGLRSFRDGADASEPPVHFSALEMVATTPMMLLLGEAGSGKTSFAKHLALNLAGEILGDVPFGHARLSGPVARNDLGSVEPEAWSGKRTVPLYLQAQPGHGVDQLLETAWPGALSILQGIDWADAQTDVLLIIDGLERLGAEGAALLQAAADFAGEVPNARVLALGDAAIVKQWAVPFDYTKQGLIDLPAAQRRLFAATVLGGYGARLKPAMTASVSGLPGLFALSSWLDAVPDNAVALVNAWRDAAAATLDLPSAETLGLMAFETLSGKALAVVPAPLDKRFALSSLAVVHLSRLTSSDIATLFHGDSDVWSASVAALAQQYGSQLSSLAGALMRPQDDKGLRGALLVAPLLPAGDDLAPRASDRLLTIVEQGRLSLTLRQTAGRILAGWGDPRDLDAMVDVAVGTFTMGAHTHPNSAPPHAVSVEAFKIGRYPVTNARYGAFVRATGRKWSSKDGGLPERANAPAVDLTWHDARAFCDWLTIQWRRDGHIAANTIVRLPTEVEWERAARGDQEDPGDAMVYPWGNAWADDAANSEEAGLNDTCTVGLFPKGVSPYGCLDMAGQVWEWTTTLWGDNMTTPTLKFPYVDDGRENPDAGPSIRRVLRGGCFSSGRLKANCTYRGSLEPNGSWRGNGFRVVVK